jgi:hypothetical protein
MQSGPASLTAHCIALAAKLANSTPASVVDSFVLDYFAGRP